MTALDIAHTGMAFDLTAKIFVGDISGASVVTAQNIALYSQAVYIVQPANPGDRC